MQTPKFKPGDLIRLKDYMREYLTANHEIYLVLSSDVTNTVRLQMPGYMFADEIFEVQLCNENQVTFYIHKLSLYCTCHTYNVKDANAP